MNIVFDFAGVLFTWKPQEFIARLLPEHAATDDAARALVVDFFEGFGGDWADFDRGTIASAPLAERIAKRTGLSVNEARKVIDAVPHELQPIEATVALLRRLHARGHALYFLSNMPASYADHLDASHEFLGLFRAGVFSARVQLIKPEPEIFAHAVEAFGIDARDTLFIDDLLPNAEAAREAGWQAIHFQSPAQCEAELQRLGLL
jgi:putative hydrolase of the HAD superfamily